MHGADVDGRRVTLFAFVALFSWRTLGALRTLGASLPLCARNALHALRALRAGRALRTRITFRARISAACRERKRQADDEYRKDIHAKPHESSASGGYLGIQCLQRFQSLDATRNWDYRYPAAEPRENPPA